MAFTSKEVKDLVEKLDPPFQALDKNEDKYHKIDAGTFNYESVIPAELGSPVPAITRSLSELDGQMFSVLGIPTRPVVYLARGGETADKERDATEVFFDYARYRMDPHGFHRRVRKHHSIRSRFGVDILSINPYAPPEDMDTEAYDEAYWRWRQDTPDPRTIRVQEDADKYSVALVNEEVPFIDLASYLPGRDKGEGAQKFLQRTVPSVKLGNGQSPYDSDGSMMQKVRRIITYTDEKICQYIEQSSSRDSGGRYAGKGYELLTEEDNPFGQVPVVLYPGIYRPHMEVEERYEGMNWPAAQLEYNLILMHSIALTIFGNQRLVDQLDKDVVQTIVMSIQNPATDADELHDKLQKLIIPQRDRKGQPGTSMAFGTVADVTRTLGAEWVAARDYFAAERERLWASWQAVFPSPDTVEKGTAAAIFAAIEQGRARSEEALGIMIAGEQKLFEMIAYDIAKTHKQEVNFKTYGGELTAPRSDIKSGSEFKITPDVMMQFCDGRATVSLEPVPDTRAQTAAAVMEEVQAQAAVGVRNAKRIYEAMGVANVTERMEEDAALTQASYLGPGMAQRKIRSILTRKALEEERPVEVVMQEWMPQFDTQGAGGPQQAGGGGTQYRAPELPQPGLGGQQTAPMGV